MPVTMLYTWNLPNRGWQLGLKNNLIKPVKGKCRLTVKTRR